MEGFWKGSDKIKVKNRDLSEASFQQDIDTCIQSLDVKVILLFGTAHHLVPITLQLQKVMMIFAGRLKRGN